MGGLDEKMNEALLWELFLQAGPVGESRDPPHTHAQLETSFLCLMCDFAISAVNVHVPRDRITQTHQGYGFVEFMSEDDADYAIKIMNMIKLFGKPIRVNKVREDSVLYCIQYTLLD